CPLPMVVACWRRRQWSMTGSAGSMDRGCAARIPCIRLRRSISLTSHQVEHDGPPDVPGGRVLVATLPDDALTSRSRAAENEIVRVDRRSTIRPPRVEAGSDELGAAEDVQLDIVRRGDGLVVGETELQDVVV